MPPVKTKMRQTPRHHSERPPIIFLGERPGAMLASHLSVGDGAVPEAGKGGALRSKADTPGRWVDTFCATTTKQT